MSDLDKLIEAVREMEAKATAKIESLSEFCDDFEKGVLYGSRNTARTVLATLTAYGEKRDG